MDRPRILSIIQSSRDSLEPPDLVNEIDVASPALYLLKTAYSDFINGLRTTALKKIEAALDSCWEDLNTGHWSEVPESPKHTFAYGSLFKVVVILSDCEHNDSWEGLNKAVYAADLGLMMGSGFHTQLSTLASSLSLLTPDEHPFYLISSPARPPFIPDEINGSEIPSLTMPSLEMFHNECFKKRLPFKILGMVQHWPAYEKWRDVNYLLRTAGARTLPIEIGSSYTDNEWGMHLCTLKDFIHKYILQKNPKVGYLAQHQLFDQIPALRDDILTPEYCCLTETEADDVKVDINAWFGPSGTLSPLHFDPKHNLLCQVIGSKKVLLYSPEDSDHLYPIESTMLKNTSHVDPYNPDHSKYPDFKMAQPFQTILNPGDMLYIPPKWWHRVESLDISFSVSFWWE